MGWLSDYKQDVAAFAGPQGGSPLKHVLGEQGLWALLQYRIESAVYRSQLPFLIKKPLRMGLVVSHKIIETITGMCLPCTAQLGPGLHLPHCGSRVVHSGVVIGSGCCICQGVALGVSGRGEKRGVPRVGDRVYFGVNSVVVGKIVVGDDVLVSANSLVTRDVPAGSTMLGVPASVVNNKGSEGYLASPAPQNAALAAKQAKIPRRLLILARVKHYAHNDRLYAYTPYARELDVWAELFPEVVIAGTLIQGPPPADCTAFIHNNIKVKNIIEAGGDGLGAKLRQAVLLPGIVWQVAHCILKADAVHVRCPCDLGFLGVLLGPLGSDRLIAKYATQWMPYDQEPWTWRLQRALLRSWWWHGPVTVYGQWPDQPAKVIPFFTSMLTEAQLQRAREASQTPRDPCVFRILFVGRLSTSKNVDVLLKAVSMLQIPKKRIECVVVGEGARRADLEWQSGELGLANSVKFTGGLDFDEVLDWYTRSNVLVLVSDVEGWPKAIAEGMAFGLVCIGTERGMVPQMMAEGRGVLVPSRNPSALATELQYIATHPQEAAAMARRAAQWAQRYSLEGLKLALGELMERQWNR